MTRDPEAFAVLGDLLLDRWPPEFHSLIPRLRMRSGAGMPALERLWYASGPGTVREVIDRAGLAPEHGPPRPPSYQRTWSDSVRIDVDTEMLAGAINRSEAILAPGSAAAQLERATRLRAASAAAGAAIDAALAYVQALAGSGPAAASMVAGPLVENIATQTAIALAREPEEP